MKYNSCTVSFPKTIESKNKTVIFEVNEIYNSSLLGNSCPLFKELDQISDEMAKGLRVKLEL